MSTSLSVIIPLSEPNAFLRESVESVLSSERTDIECIVATSADEHPCFDDLPLDDRRLRVLRFRDASVGRLINQSLNVANGAVFAVLSPDDLLVSETIPQIVERFSRHTECKILCGGAHTIGIDGRLNRRINIGKPSLARLRERNCLYHSAVFYRRTILDELGGFEENRKHWTHYEYWIRAAQAKIPFDMLNARLALKRAYPMPSGYDYAGEIESAYEAMELTKAKYGTPGTRWAIRLGRSIAARRGITRAHSLAYDYITLTSALNEVLPEIESRLGRWQQRARIFRQHLSSEVNKIRRKPRLALRLFTSSPQSKLQRALGRRLFQLRFEDPQPCRLPADYFSTPTPDSPPKISIVTPNLNQGVFIERTIRSVIDQDYPNLQYTVQDGCSKDDSVEVVRRYEQHFSSWESARDTGQTQAINRGLARTDGEIMAYLNSDDVLLPGSLAYVAKYFIDHPKIDVVYGNRLLIDDNDDVINYWVLPSHDSETLRWADYVPQETLFWRRRAWEKVGAHFDESFQFAMDWDLILRFQAAGLNFKRLPRFLGAFRISDSQKTSQWINTHGIREMNRLRVRELGFCPTEPEVTRQVRGYVKRQRYAQMMYDLAESINPLLTPYFGWKPGTRPQSVKPVHQAA